VRNLLVKQTDCHVAFAPRNDDNINSSFLRHFERSEKSVEIIKKWFTQHNKPINNKHMKTKLITLSILLICFIFSALPLMAQPPTPPDLGSDAPVDGGLSLLIAAGAGYGIKKVREMRKKNNEADK